MNTTKTFGEIVAGDAAMPPERERWQSRHRVPMTDALEVMAHRLNNAVNDACGSAELGYALKVATHHPDDAGDGWVPFCEHCGDEGCNVCEPNAVLRSNQGSAWEVKP